MTNEISVERMQATIQSAVATAEELNANESPLRPMANVNISSAPGTGKNVSGRPFGVRASGSTGKVSIIGRNTDGSKFRL